MDEIEQLRQKYGITPQANQNNQERLNSFKSLNSGVSASGEETTVGEKPSAYQEKVVKPLEEFSTGFVKSGLGTLQNIGKGVMAAVTLGKADTSKYGIPKEILERKTPAEKIGAGVEQIAEFAIPAGKVAKITEGANFLTKLATRMVTSGTVATVQAGKIGKETAIAAGTEAVLPVAGKVFNVVKRLFKGLGSGLSGVSTDVIDTIVENPGKAMEVSKQLAEKGNFGVLEQNAREIVNGISNIKQQARKAFGEGLEKLSTTDIKPSVFRANTQKILDKYGVIKEGGEKILNNVEFNEPKNVQKAISLVERLHNAKLDGKSLRKLADDIESAAYKTATSDERLSFNVFVRDLSDTLKTAVSESTDKLKEINKAFSTDMQLAEEIERIFSDVEFKNLSEVGKVAQKLEALFSQKGLNPRDIDNFLTRIGVGAGEFRTSEAVRQIANKSFGANPIGTSFSEMFRSVTSAVVTPKAVKNIAIATGLTEQVLNPILNRLEPAARGTLLKLLINKQD